MKHNLKRLTALILALSMCLSLFSMTAWATDVEMEAIVDEVVAEETLEAEGEPAEESAEETEEAAPAAAEDSEEEVTVSAAKAGKELTEKEVTVSAAEEAEDTQADASAVDLSTCAVTVADATYDGTAKEPAVTVTNADGNILAEDKDYTVVYDENMVNAGSYTVTVTGTGSYAGSEDAVFTIVPASISGYTVTLSATSYTYNGSAKKPTVTVKNDAATLDSSNYNVSYSNNTNAGTATVTVIGKGNYTGTVSKTFTIAKASQTVTATAAASSIYAGKTTTVTGKGTGTITYTSSNTSIATVNSSGKVTGKKPGTVTITVKAAGNSNYKSASKTVKITVKLNKTTISSLTNTSKGVTVKWSKVTGASGYYIYRNNKQVKKITSGSTVSYTDTGAKTNGTKYQYKIYAYYGSTKSAASSTKTIYYVSTPSISSVKSSTAKKATVKWKKNAKASGYQIQYSTSSSFSSSKTVSVSKASTVSKTISSLTGGKTYYVRVRAYKTVSGTKYYSAWSSKKSVKVKGSSSTSSTSSHASTVYITKTGSKFHRSGCKYLSSSKTSISRSKAIAQGYTACSVCDP
ncbi:MAG: fibronectin type III domain-containing protein [Clostridiales bacterium]|nr:fibronectin type III domain-containing protein [Clostridiales bacterium]